MQRDMNQPTGSKTAKQLVLVVLLCIGLLVALTTQPEKSTSHLPASLAPMPELAITTVALQTRSQGDQVALDLSQFQVTQLNRLPLDVASRVDLFAAVSDISHSTKPLEARGEVLVNAIYGAHDQTEHSALIGDQIVRQGHGLADGRTVTEVSPDGVKITDGQ